MINEIQKQKVIMHVDMDCFFAACLQWKYPEYHHKPIVVSYKADKSIIVTSSYEARALGVKTALPLFKAKQISDKIIQVDPEYSLFSKMSRKTFGLIYEEFCPILEQASIDECYLDVTNYWQKYGTPKKMAQAIKNRVKEIVGITCSIGISDNKFLAKTASPLNKPDGVYSLNPKNYKALLWNKEIKEMYGVGKSLASRFHKLGVYTIGDLALIPNDVLKKNIGKYGLDLKAHANGIGSTTVNPYHEDYKNISNDKTLDFPLYDDEHILDILFKITEHVSKRAIGKRMVGNTVSITIRYKWNKKEGEEFDKTKHYRVGINKQVTLKEYTNDVEKMYSFIKNLYLNNIDSEKGVMFLAVALKNTVKQDKIPIQLQIDELNDKQAYLDKLFNLSNQHMNSVIHKAKDIEHSHGKYSEQSSYFERDRIHFNEKAKK